MPNVSSSVAARVTVSSPVVDLPRRAIMRLALYATCLGVTVGATWLAALL